MEKRGKTFKSETFIFIILIILLIIYRFWILINFGFKYTDSDQTIMWLATVDYYHKSFHEPCFYGQSYNTMLESFLAIPLYAVGCPLYIALPVVTSLLTLFPFIYISILTFIKRSKKTAILLLSLTFLLPIEYDLLTCLSRGFVTGIAIVSLSFHSLFRPFKRNSFFLFGLLSAIGFIVNSNSILLSMPCLLFLFLNNFKNKYFYIEIIMSLLCGFVLFYLMKSFYIYHPNYNLHKYDYKFSWSFFVNGFSSLDKLFNYITPIFWKQGFVVLFIPIIFTAYFFKRKMHIEALVSASLSVLILLSLFVSKVYNGTTSIFFPYARMYLAIPLVLVVLLSFIRTRNKYFTIIFVLISVFILSYKFIYTKKEIKECMNRSKSVIGVMNTKKLLSECEELSTISQKYNIDLMVISFHWNYDFYNYGCPACIEDFPKTLRPAYERRTWRLIEDENYVYENLMIIDLKRDLSNEFDFVSKIQEKSGFYLIKNNILPTKLLLDKLNITVRPY
ncbi:MAG TPA: hypothetical protein P5035_03495 [Bacteroidales bacterium]|nr:hypothetical protein [Bacteroidales bacterium]HXK63831.1 hypothetical protein [Bacteroidales bacterium]